MDDTVRHVSQGRRSATGLAVRGSGRLPCGGNLFEKIARRSGGQELGDTVRHVPQGRRSATGLAARGSGRLPCRGK